MMPLKHKLFLDNDPRAKQTGRRYAAPADICPADPEPLFSYHDERNQNVWGGWVQADTGVCGHWKPPILS